MSGRVVIAGSVAVEETIRKEPMSHRPGMHSARRLDLAVGGTAALAATAAAAVGAVSRCVGAVGSDPSGVAVRRHLARLDVDVTTVLPAPGPTTRWVRTLATAADRDNDIFDDIPAPDLGELLVLPGADGGAESVAVEHALDRCEPGDALLVEWSSLEGLGTLVTAAYDLDMQIIALLSPYPTLPQGIELRDVDVAVVDQQGAAWLADAGELPSSLCVVIGREGISWAGETVVAPANIPATHPADRAHAVLAGALAGRLACGDDRAEAASAALSLFAEYERGIGPRGAAGPWPLLRLDLEELG